MQHVSELFLLGDWCPIRRKEALFRVQFTGSVVENGVQRLRKQTQLDGSHPT